MQYKVFMLKDNDENSTRMYMSWDALVRRGITPSESDYEEVYCGTYIDVDIECMLDGIFTVLNTAHPEDYNNRSLSVGDLIVFENDPETVYFCDSFGWKKLDRFLEGRPAV